MAPRKWDTADYSFANSEADGGPELNPDWKGAARRQSSLDRFEVKQEGMLPTLQNALREARV
eukprot:scaffold27128_cov30-Prasinocladus_malaysianus.AAC.3